VKLLSLDLTGYRQFAEPLRIDLPAGLVGVCGPNGVGKSKLVESIGFALYGPNRRLLPSGDRAVDLVSRGAPGSKVSVTLRLELRGQVVRVTRTQKTASLELEGGPALADTPRGVTKRITQLLRLSPDAFLGTFVARQREVSRLLTMRPNDRQRLVNRLIGISQVETAIGLAKEERAKRSQAVAVATAIAIIQPDVAQRTVNERLDALSEAERDLQEKQEARDALEEECRVAREVLDEARSARDLLVELRKQMKELAEHELSLDREVTGASNRLEQAMAADSAVKQALTTLDKTSGALEDLEAFRLLKQKQELKRQLLTLTTDSKERARRLQTVSAATDRRLDLNQNLAELRQRLASAMVARESANSQAKRISDRKASALKLGADGICDVCGQRYGANFTSAVAHLDQELDDLQKAALRIGHEVAEAEEELAQLEQSTQDLESELLQLEASVEELAEIPGRLTVCRDQLATMDGRLGELGRASTKYDQAAHDDAEARALRRTEAAGQIERLSPLAQSRPDAERTLGTALATRRDLETRRQQLLAALGTAENETAGFETKKQTLEAVEATHRIAVDAVTSAVGAVAAKTVLRDQATRDLEVAIETAAVLRAARRDALVAERTDDVLVRLLTEITDEARPRLSELMDTWGRSLLGSRFKSVGLSEDYGIVADNGSGPHELAHFSGGEQTVLSVMLRVAISLFCRERAGFDTGFLILDEIFGDQDSERRVLLVEFLSEIQRHYHQVIVVNHVDDVTAMLDCIIDVVPTGSNTSSAIMRS
jgi:DNA repair exonuclease SbcCD ATPase subunit